MKKKKLYILLILGFSVSIFSQNKKAKLEKDLLEHFNRKYTNSNSIINDSISFNYISQDFKISVSENPIDFDTIKIVKKNPYILCEDYEPIDSDKEYTKEFPKSFSVIYGNSLVSLFENGKFSCLDINDFKRNTDLENKLNTKRFKYHWIINNQLAGLSKNIIYLWNGKKWKKYKDNFPLKNQPILFEDQDYIIYNDCYGEWGGTVYFYHKKTLKTYFTESTCSNSIIKSIKGYEVLAHLGHDSGSSEIKIISDPRKLTLAKEAEINTRVKGEALGYTDKSNAYLKKLDFYGIQIFSSFTFNNKELYIVHHSDLTFIAEIKSNEIEIVNPLFLNDLYTHNPITKKYENCTLINLDHYGTGRYREISVIIINGKKITKLDWNKNHSR